MNKNFILDSADAFLEAYNRVMEKTRNPNMAMSAASSITMAYMTIFKDEQKVIQQSAEVIGTLFSALSVIKQENQREEDDDEQGK